MARRAGDSVGLDLLADCPDKALEFARDLHHDLVAVDAVRAEPTKPRAQPQLRLPGDGDRRLGQSTLPAHDDRAYRRAVSIGPGRLHQRAARRVVARLGNCPLPATIARGVFARDQPEIDHELARVVKTRQIAELGHHARGVNELYP